MYQLRSHMAGEQLELLESSIAETSAKKEKPANPMFKATMNDARLFRNLIGAISSLIEEADFNASPDGIKLRSMDQGRSSPIHFDEVKAAKLPLLREAAQNFLEAGNHERRKFEDFKRENAWWLEDFVLFDVMRQVHDGAMWSSWPKELARREPEGLRRFGLEHQRELEAERVVE